MAGSGDTHWVQGHVGDVVGDLGPAVDHTTGSTIGGFIYANLTGEASTLNILAGNKELNPQKVSLRMYTVVSL